MDQLLLSICIPTYNRAKIVYECVQNCLKIESNAIEVVVNDNCSTDDTKELLSTITDERFYYYCNENNIGYQNFAVALKKGKAKYALLLSDEDDIVKLDLEKVLKQLEDAQDVAVFQCEYVDEADKCLIGGPPERFEGNTGRIYCYTLRYFLYAAALIVNTAVLEKVWDQIDKEEFLWSLYPQCVVAEYCVQKGALEKLNNIQVKRSQRNNKGTIDTKAWGGKTEEPYWSLIARRIQSEAWINLFWSLKLDTNKINRIFLEILIMHARHIVNYRKVLKSEVYKEEILFLKRRDVIERDLKISKFEWFNILFETNKSLKKIENDYLKSVGRTLEFDKTYYKKMKGEVIGLLKNM